MLTCGLSPHLQGILYPPEYGGTRPADFDAFYELILCDEFSRVGGGNVLGQMAINSMALPPIFHAGSKYLKDKVCRDVIVGKKNICLAISEPWAGSDVANIKTTAKRVGDHYVVNGQKKWITGGTYGDYFTMAVRTGGDGMGGISLLLVEADTPGLSVRKMETQVRPLCHCSCGARSRDCDLLVQSWRLAVAIWGGCSRCFRCCCSYP